MLEHSNNFAVLGKFGAACVGSILDWRKKCKDEILWRIPMVIVDEFYDNHTYRALIKSETSINFREAWNSEGGDQNPNCCPSTANSNTELCEFRLPELQHISIGLEPRCYQDWTKSFCKTYPIYKGQSPFRVVGSQVQLLPGESDVKKTFLHYIKSELAQAIWDHVYLTAWTGRDERVDQWNALFYYLENGIQPQDQGSCDYPLQPTTINIAEYVHGAAEAANGTCAAPGDCILALDDPDRPGDAPADNILRVYEGTCFETEADITGMDTIDLMVMWLELIMNEWGVNVSEWFLGIPRNQYKCLAQVAACKQSCSGGDCRHLLIGDNRDDVRAERESKMIWDKQLNLYPYEGVSIPMYQSEALGQTNRLLFIPERFTDAGGNEVYWMLWAWRNLQAEANKLFADVPNLRSTLNLQPSRIQGDFDGELYDGGEFEMGSLMDQGVWHWLAETECNSVRWWNNAETGMIPQAPHLWLLIDGICCDKVLTLPCCGHNVFDSQEFTITDMVNTAPPAGYVATRRVAFDCAEAPEPYELGDNVDILFALGNGHYGGVVTQVTTYAGGGVCEVFVSFTEELTEDPADHGGVAYIRNSVNP